MATHMVAHRSRDADAAGWAFGLEPCNYIHRVPMQIGPICNRVADVDPNTETDSQFRRVILVMDRNPLLHLHGAANRSVDAIEHDEQRITARLDDPATVLAIAGSIRLLRSVRSR